MVTMQNRTAETEKSNGMGPTSEEIYESKPQNKQPMVWKMVEIVHNNTIHKYS